VQTIAGRVRRWSAGVRHPGTPDLDGDLPDAARTGIAATMDALVDAWNAQDAAAYGARFTEDATYVAFTGSVYQGREDITTGHDALFRGLLRGTRLCAARYLDVALLAPTVARVVTRGDTCSGDAPPAAPAKVQTYLLVERDGTWLVAAFHTQRRTVMERLQFRMNPGSVPRRERRGQLEA
jgi:uncharacterized protein (TIGR02246 family)